MKLSKYLTDIISLALIGASLSGAYFLSQKITTPKIIIHKQQSALNIDSSFLKYFNLGQKRLYSSILWITTILESDIEHYKGKNLNSWMLLRFKTISEIDPRFYVNYNFGALYLSIIKDDIEGASFLYKKGLEAYPNDFNLLKNSSFHFYYEAQDYNTAKKILSVLKNHPKVNPMMLSTLARIEANKGNTDDAFQILLDAYNSLSDKKNLLGEKIYGNLYAIKSEKDLNCLNNFKDNCSLVDLNGEPYFLSRHGKYKAKRNWQPFRVKIKNK